MTEREITDEEMGRELTDLARRIRAYQDSRGWTTARLIREYRGIGSDRTFRSLRDGNTDGYDLSAQLEAYRAVADAMAESDARSAEEPVYEDMSAVRDIRLAATGAMGSWGNNRVVIVIGDSGIGKSKALEALCRNYGSRIVTLEAIEVWRDNPGDFLGALLDSLGEVGYGQGATARLARARARLSRQRCMVAVDEAQHLGPRCLAAVKALINATPGEWMLLSIGTRGWMASEAYIEARQLATNRLHSLVRLRLQDGDIIRYLAHIFPKADRGALKGAAALIRPAAAGNGNMAFVRDAASEAKAMTEEGSSPDAKIWAEAVRAIAERRNGTKSKTV